MKTLAFSREARGFTLIELVVVVGVMTLILSIMLANNARFGGTITLRGLAYDVGLTIRQSQTYGISVKKYAGAFQTGYGAHFDVADKTRFVLFGDANQNGVYDAPGEFVSESKMNQGYTVAELCSAAVPGGSMTHGVSAINIVFKRPDPDARILATISGVPTTQAQARVVLSSPRGDLMSVIVDTPGQISVSAGGCP